MKKIDILLPTLNRSHLIENTIESVLNQTNPNWNLIILDNNSSDRTSSVCSKYKSDNRVKYKKNSSTLPAPDNWEKAISFSNSDYFIVLSDDDLLTTNFVEELLNQIMLKEADIFVTNRATCDLTKSKAIVKKKLRINKSISYKTQTIDPMAMAINYGTGEAIRGVPNLEIHPSMLIIKKELKNRIKEIYGEFYRPASHDYYSGVMMGLYAKNMIFVDKPLIIIGGFTQGQYCFHSNRFREYFGMEFSLSDALIIKYCNDLPRLTKRMEELKDLPYFHINIVKQTLITLDLLSKKDKQKFICFLQILQKYEGEIIKHIDNSSWDNYLSCLVTGDMNDKRIESLLKRPVEEEAFLKKKTTNFLRKLLLLINFFQIPVICKLLCFVHNFLNRENRWVYYTTLKKVPYSLVENSRIN